MFYLQPYYALEDKRGGMPTRNIKNRIADSTIVNITFKKMHI